MESRARKSTALISLVLVPLNLLGLGFVAGCDSRDNEETPNFASSTDGSNTADGDETAGVDFEDPDDPFNLDPVDAPATASDTGASPVAYPTTQPLARSSFATLPPNHVTHYYHHSGPSVVFLPIPFRTGYQPPYRAPFHSSSSSSSVFRSSPSHSSGVSRSSSSGTSRGGFGSSAASHSASS
jgi:hypothetical protein